MNECDFVESWEIGLMDGWGVGNIWVSGGGHRAVRWVASGGHPGGVNATPPARSNRR